MSLKLPFLVTKHNTYTVVTKDYLHPSFLQKKYRPAKKHDPIQKVSLLKRNSRIIQIGHAVAWTTFITLTFRPEFYWDDYDLIQQEYRSFIKSLYKLIGRFKYLAVLEHGGKTSRVHYHLLTDIPFSSKIFEHAFHTKRKVCNAWKYGWSDVVAVDNKNCNAVFYLAKYLSKNTKDRTPIGKREVFSSRGLNKIEKYVTFDVKLAIDNLQEYRIINKSTIYVKRK